MDVHTEVVRCINSLGSISAVADMLGLSRVSVNSWYNGNTVPKINHLIKLLDLCDKRLVIVKQ